MYPITDRPWNRFGLLLIGRWAEMLNDSPSPTYLPYSHMPRLTSYPIYDYTGVRPGSPDSSTVNRRAIYIINVLITKGSSSFTLDQIRNLTSVYDS